MDFTTFLPRDLHKTFAVFGKSNWLTYAQPLRPSAKPQSIEVLINTPHYDPKLNIPISEWNAAVKIIRTIASDRIYLSWLYMLSKSIAYGPKVFYPNLEQCESMSQIDVEIAVRDFQQPYPTIIYQFPKEFSAAIQKQFDLPWRATSCVIHIDNSGFVLLGIVMDNDDRIVNICPPHTERLEDYLLQKMPNLSGSAIADAEIKACHLIERVCLNCGMLLMQYPIKKEPADSKQWAKNRKRPDERQKLFQLADMEQLSFQQNIVIREVQHTGLDGNQPLTHHSPHAHWRRGHWRMQPHGPKLSLRKLLLIKPVFVNSQMFLGDLSQTNVDMRKK